MSWLLCRLFGSQLMTVKLCLQNKQNNPTIKWCECNLAKFQTTKIRIAASNIPYCVLRDCK